MLYQDWRHRYNHHHSRSALGVDDTGCVRRYGARESGGADAMMRRAHQAHETRAVPWAADARSDRPMT